MAILSVSKSDSTKKLDYLNIWKDALINEHLTILDFQNSEEYNNASSLKKLMTTTKIKDEEEINL